jgi:replicative DNA helicase
VILDKAESLILSIAEDRIKQGFVHIGEVASRQLTVIEETAGREQLITGLATGFADLDYMTSGLQRGDLIIIAARPSMGKCLTADSEITLADGSVATIQEIYQKRQATLLTLGDDFKFRLTQPSAFVDDGIKPVYRVTTRLGRYVDSTLSHPYLTIDGWRKLAELKVGDHIAVPRRVEIFGDRQLRADEIESLACASRDRFIPPVVFQLAKPQLELFLKSLLDMGAIVSRTRGQAVGIGYSTISERLARQMQHLLLRFGVIAKLSKKPLEDDAADCRPWLLEIADAHSLRQVYSEIRVNPPNGSWGMFQVQLANNAANLLIPPTAVGGYFRSNLHEARRRDLNDPPTAVGGIRIKRDQRRSDLNDPPTSVGGIHLPSISKHTLSQLAESDVYWDEIVSIEYLGDKQVYDLTIPETHNFVANDICVHNTAFSLNIAQNAATHPQHNGEKAVVGVFSLEMSNEQLVNRMLCSQARVDAHRLRSGYLSKDEWRRLAVAVGELAETRIYLDDTPGISVLEMRAKARRLKNEQKALDLLIVDYLQLMSGRGRSESRQQEVSQISRELKMLAKELNVPLVALSQLSRAPETRTGSHKPQLSDLRESGSIEQDSDVVMFIYREEVYKPETEKQNIAEIIIGKQRNGPIGSVELVFLKQLTKFEDKYREQA